MRYARGGITGRTGQSLGLSVDVPGTAPPPEPAPRPTPPPRPRPDDVPLDAIDPELREELERKKKAKKEEPPPEPPKPSPRPDYPLLPADLMQRYLKRSFDFKGEKIEFELDHLLYQNLGIDKELFMGTKDAMVGLFSETKRKDPALLEELCGPFAQQAPAWIMHCFSGKGSPDMHLAAMKLAAHYQKRLGAAWKDKGSLTESLKAFYRNNMGLDCNGLAGNYCVAVGDNPLTPSTFIPNFAPSNKRRRSVDEIQGGDLMIWGQKHIATIQGRRPDGNFDIVESAGNTTAVKGLGPCVREIQSAGGDKFRARVIREKNGPWEEVFVSTIK